MPRYGQVAYGSYPFRDSSGKPPLFRVSRIPYYLDHDRHKDYRCVI